MSTLRNPFADGLRTESQGALQPTMFKPFCGVGADASGGATHITYTAAAVGDKVMCCLDITDHSDVSADFEAIVSVNGQLQQSSTNLSAKTLVIILLSQSNVASP